jgi:hypothetical protein
VPLKLLALYKTLWVFTVLKKIIPFVFAYSCCCSTETTSDLQVEAFKTIWIYPYKPLEAETFVMKQVQQSCIPKEIHAIKETRDIPKLIVILPLLMV